VSASLTWLRRIAWRWAALPKDRPPRGTVHDDFARWDWDGPLGRIHPARYGRRRELAPVSLALIGSAAQARPGELRGREASLSAAILDSQSGKGAEKALMGAEPLGW
jgi:hypothetical protein